MSFACAALIGAAALLGCGGSGDDTPVTITVAGPNAVSQWNEIAATTINLPATATGTPEEQRPNISVDLATVQVAVYDAVMAIAGTHRPFAITPTAPAAGASQEAAVAAAAYGVLSGLFPSRGAAYQAAYDAFLATLPDGNAKTLGLAVGAEVAAGILALRAGDGRMVALAPYVPGTAPGQFRGTNPVGRPNPFIKPFVLTSNAQFRAPGPPALTSTAYAADVNETKSLGSATSTTRTAEQTETARFHTEPPPNFWPRNMRNFAMTARSLPEQARLMAMIWVAQADAGTPASSRSTSTSPGARPAPSRSTATATPRPSSTRPGPRSYPRPTIRNTRRRTVASPRRWRRCCAATTAPPTSPST
jgi:hypothetical protein